MCFPHRDHLPNFRPVTDAAYIRTRLTRYQAFVVSVASAATRGRGFRIVNPSATPAAAYIHCDHFASVRMVTLSAAAKQSFSAYTAFGVQTQSTFTALPPNQDGQHGFIGEVFDADAGLQYRGARSQDPALGRFLSPDWWDPMLPGVGTNR